MADGEVIGCFHVLEVAQAAGASRACSTGRDSDNSDPGSCRKVTQRDKQFRPDMLTHPPVRDPA
jgi:hypothetical protein